MSEKEDAVALCYYYRSLTLRDQCDLTRVFRMGYIQDFNCSKTTFFHLKNIYKLRPMLSTSNAEMLIHAFMTSRLDYCNALLGACSACLINKLQMVQNAASRVLTRTRNYDHITPVMSTLAPY